MWIQYETNVSMGADTPTTPVRPHFHSTTCSIVEMDLIIICACLPIVYSLLRAGAHKRTRPQRNDFQKEINHRDGKELKSFVSSPLAYTSSEQDNPELLGGEPYQGIAWPDSDQPAEHPVHSRCEQRGVSTSNFV